MVAYNVNFYSVQQDARLEVKPEEHRQNNGNLCVEPSLCLELVVEYVAPEQLEGLQPGRCEKRSV